MRITNISSTPKYFAYAGPGTVGCTLKPGQTSSDVPFKKVFEPVLWKDLENGVTAMRLSDDDRKFIDKLMFHHLRPIPDIARVETKAPTGGVKKPVKKQAEAISRKRAAADTPKAAYVPAGLPANTPNAPIGQPEFSSEGQDTMSSSLAKLKQMNARLASGSRIPTLAAESA